MFDAALPERWLDRAQARAALEVRRIGLADCAQWHLTERGIEHATGGFFAVRGLRHWLPETPEQSRFAPYLDQPEIGLLGFVVRAGPDGVEWLLQAKTEPGNVGGTQVAPTVQATRSNYLKLHGGSPTRFLDLFADRRYLVSDGAHSEQGGQFLLKFNRDAVVALPGDKDFEPGAEENWRWVGSGGLRQLLGQSFLVNTDARSVIATAPWALLGQGGRLFRSEALRRSYGGTVQARLLPAAQGLARQGMGWEIVALDAMPGWQISDQAILSPEGEERIGFYQVAVQGREVAAWCQPLACQAVEGDFCLLTQVVKGELLVCLTGYAEPGFGGRIELGPTLSAACPTPEPLVQMLAEGAPQEVAAIRQSDEGGRFMQVTSGYRILHLTRPVPWYRPPTGGWVRLATLERITRQSGATTNELRTLVSLLLSAQADADYARILAG